MKQFLKKLIVLNQGTKYTTLEVECRVSYEIRQTLRRIEQKMDPYRKHE